MVGPGPTHVHPGAGDDEAVIVAEDLVGQPPGVWLRADEQEQGIGRSPADVAGGAIAQLHGREQSVSPATDHLVAGQQRDVGSRLDGGEQVVRHGGGQPVAADDEKHFGHVLLQVHHGLAGRVAPSHDDHAAASETAGLRSGGPVEESGATEALQLGDPQLPVGDPHGEHDRPGHHRRAVVEHQPVPIDPRFEAGNAVHQQEAGPEGPRLLVAALGEVGPGDAPSEPEVVPDQRAGRRLATDGLAFDDEGLEALRRRVDRGRQPAGPAPMIATSTSVGPASSVVTP